MARLKRTDCSGPGLRRRRAGRGFTYREEDGERVADPETIERIRSLAIPPAWEEVWICPLDNGHIQATGVDQAGRRQYLYHDRWHATRANRKFESLSAFAESLPVLRRQVNRDLALRDMPRDRVLACAVRLIDIGNVRVGGEQYAEENETYGVATVLRSQVSRVASTGLRFEYPAKGALTREVTVKDAQVRETAEPLLRRRSGPEDFLVYRDHDCGDRTRAL